MRIFRKVSVQFAAAALLLFTISPMALAQATRTWVSGVGDDVNPCSRTAPCKTFAGAISKTAAGGVINTLDPGGFGTVTITKAISIVGVDGAGILNAGTTAIIINAGAADVVTLANITIDGFGSGVNGVRVTSAGTVNLRNVNISSLSVTDPANGRGVLVNNASGSVRVNLDRVTVSNSLGGVLVAPTGSATADVDISRSHFAGNTNGIRLTDRSTVSMHNSVVTGNRSNGIVVFASSGAAFLNAERSQITGNGTATPGAAGLSVEGGFATAFISELFVTDNPVGLSTSSGGAIVSFSNNRVFGNGSDGNATSFATSR